MVWRTPGNGDLYGSKGKDVISGGSGNDTLMGGKGRDTLMAGDGSAVVNGGKGDDSLGGGSGHDTLNGGGGANDLNGGAGGTVFISHSGKDHVSVGTGNDTLSGTPGDDQIVNDNGGSISSGDVPPPMIPPAPVQSPPSDTPVATEVGTVSGILTGPDGMPVADATVVLCTTSGDNGGYTTAGSFATGTDANGAFTFTNIPAGDYVLLAGKHGVGFIQTQAAVTDGQTTTLNVQLHAFVNPGDGAGSVNGVVVDSNQAPVAGATVTLVSDADPTTSDGSSLTTTTAADGSYSFASVPAGGYAVVIVNPGVGYAHVETTVVNGQADVVNVTMQAVPPPVADGGTVSGVITDSNGNPVPNVSMALFGANGKTYGITPDAQGNFSVMVPAGTYRLLAGKKGVGTAAVEDVVVTSGQTITETLTLQVHTEPDPTPAPTPTPPPTPAPVTTGTVTGNVQDSLGMNVSNASFALILASDLTGSGTVHVNPALAGSTDANGDFILLDVPTGDYVLLVGKKGVGEARVNVTVTQDPNGTLMVTLTNTSDQT